MSEEEGKIFTSTSRAIAVLGIADTLHEAEEIAEKGTAFIQGALFHRTDIGSQEVLDRRINHMNKILNKD